MPCLRACVSAWAPKPLVQGPRREAAIDALRALALLPVIVVNFTGYANLPYGGALMRPDGTVLGDLGTGWVAALLQGKGYQLLMFLFGYSLSLAARSGTSPAQARRRLQGLLVLGLMHGFLLYMGDILGAYALLGFFVLARVRLRARALLRWVWGLGGLALVLAGWLLALTHSQSDAMGAASPSLAALSSSWAWWISNALGYASALLIGTLLMAPEALCLMLLGVLAQRLGWLRARRWEKARQRWARWAVPLVLVNLAVGALAVGLFKGDEAQADGGLSFLSMLLGPLSLASWVSWTVQHWRAHGVPAWLSEAGRQTLTPYLLSSVTAVAVWSPLGLSLRLSNASLLLVSSLLWVGLMAGARRASQRQRRLPAEAWLARR